MRGFHVGPFWELPRVPAETEGDPDGFPIQHVFGLGAFGANAFRAREAGVELVAEHDEARSGHEELYVVLSGAARFTLDGETRDTPAGTVIAVPGPGVRRRAVSTESGTALLAISAPARSGFRTTWDERHFEGVPRADE